MYILNFVLVKKRSFEIHVVMNKKYVCTYTHTYALKHIYI